MSIVDEQPNGANDDTDLVMRTLIEIWQRFFAKVEIGPDSNLLDLGATSLTAIRIRTRIRAELGREIELIDLFEHPTIRELSVIVAAAAPWQGTEPWHQVDWSDTGETRP